MAEKNIPSKRKSPDEPLLRVRDMKQYFKLGGDELKAVDNVSFDVKDGEVLGIVGESGCGKTTTGRTIIKLYEPTGGDVWFDGYHIGTGTSWAKKQVKEAEAAGNKELAAQLKKQMAADKAEVKEDLKSGIMDKMQMIFQDPVASLDPRMTVREIIAEGLRIRGITDKEYIDKKVTEMLTLVGLVPEHAERYPHEFSGGQRQRIGIARAIVLEPSLIIADEPVSALDVSIQAQVINLLNDLRNNMGLTIIFIAHDLSVVKYFSNRILVMYFGKMVELADSRELFKHPLHPYTRSLLSAIPLPDPRYEKQRKRISYVPAVDHDYSEDKPSWREVSPGHFVSCNDAEFARYQEELSK